MVRRVRARRREARVFMVSVKSVGEVVWLARREKENSAGN
jgi:hypothetical protein